MGIIWAKICWLGSYLAGRIPVDIQFHLLSCFSIYRTPSSLPNNDVHRLNRGSSSHRLNIQLLFSGNLIPISVRNQIPISERDLKKSCAWDKVTSFSFTYHISRIGVHYSSASFSHGWLHHTHSWNKILLVMKHNKNMEARHSSSSSCSLKQRSKCGHQVMEFTCSACVLCICCPLAIVWCCIKLPCKIGWRASRHMCCRSKRIFAYSSFSDIDFDAKEV